MRMKPVTQSIMITATVNVVTMSFTSIATIYRSLIIMIRLLRYGQSHVVAGSIEKLYQMMLEIASLSFALMVNTGTQMMLFTVNLLMSMHHLERWKMGITSYPIGTVRSIQ